MLGGAIHRPTSAEPVVVRHTEEVVVDASGKVPLPKDHLTGVTLTPKATTGHPIRLINLTTGVRTQITSGTMGASNTITFTNPAAGASEVAAAAGDHIRIFWEELVTAENAQESAIEVTISPDTFPGTYRVVGDTFMRSEKTGKDEAFQFVINKAKVLSKVTITLEAEGDPSTFEMSLNVLRSDNERGEKEMMKLIRYTIAESASTESANDIGSLTTGS